MRLISVHATCPNRSKIWTFRHGIYYDNGEPHTHPRLPHVLGLLPAERRQFEAIVSENPKSGPLQLITGVPTIHGPGKSVADISNCLVNADRVNKEKQKIVRHSGPLFPQQRMPRKLCTGNYTVLSDAIMPYWKDWFLCFELRNIINVCMTLSKVRFYLLIVLKQNLYKLGGIPIAYKPSQPWKTTAAHIGRTKRSRAPEARTVRQKKNDGRPPDTKKELLKKPRTKKEAKKLLSTPDIAHESVKTGIDIPTPGDWS